MRYLNTNKNIFLIFLGMLLLAACERKSNTDFSKIILNRWYSGNMKGEKWFFNFSSATEKSANGIVFIDKNKAIVTPGKISIGGDFMKIQFESTTETINGKWNIYSNELIFIRKKDGKEKSVFNLQPDYSHLSFRKRYIENIVDTVARTEVKYGSARGFYVSKKVADMNSESYPQIISEVLNELGSNLFTNDLSLKMDIYQPKGDTVSSRPLLLLIHGGAFIVGDKRDKFQQKLAVHYAKLGYVVSSINYRLGYLFIPGAYSNLERCIYRAVQDSRAALRWLIRNKKKYRIDTDKMFIAGNSAGGFIALKTAFMAESESYKSAEGNLFLLQEDLGCLDCSGNSYNEKFRLKGVINMWGALTDIEMMDEFEKVPLLLIHGDSDLIVPYGYDYPFKNVGEQYSAFFSNKLYGSKSLFEKASAMGFPAMLLTISGAGHEPQFDKHNAYTPDMKLIQTTIDSFMYAQLIIDTIHIEKHSQNEFSIAPDAGFEKVFWNISGGCIVAIPAKNIVRIVRFSNEEKCVLKALVVSKSGITQNAEIRVD